MLFKTKKQANIDLSKKKFTQNNFFLQNENLNY